jgi:hypothetical protein
MGGKVLKLRFVSVAAVWAVACGGNMQSGPISGGSHPPRDPDAGAPPSGPDGGGCDLPSGPADLCGALPTGKVAPCSQDSSGRPSQTGYLEIDSPGAAPMYVCATSWSSKASVGYVFGQPATFLSDPAGCCGGTVLVSVAPMVPQSSLGSLGTPHVPDHIKPQETERPGSGPIRQNPFAVVVTDSNSGAAATAAMATWLSWQGDGVAHPGPDGTGSYYFEPGAPINYVVLETSLGVPVIVIGPEVSLTADGTAAIGHPNLGVCPAGGGVPLAMIAGEIHGTTLNNHSGRFDYGPSATAETLDDAAKLFNCLGIPITDTSYLPPKS